MLGIFTTETVTALSDEDILLRAKAQPWVFSALLERYQEAFLRKALSIVHNRLDAEEVVQDTFTKIYINAHRFAPQEGATFSSWGYRILMNTAFTRYQKLIKEGQRFTHIDPEFEEFVGSHTNHSGFEERRDAIERILDKLPGHFASVLRLHYLERWSQEDIAGDSGESVGAVKARIHRAKAAFRLATPDSDQLLGDR
jgi:RNA polymerase sigma-70 factor (ECF subfamily)